MRWVAAMVLIGAVPAIRFELRTIPFRLEHGEI
jgi:hypothetical protein